MTNTRKRDDEKAQWLIVGIIFTGALIGIDLFYSSINEMALIARIGIWILNIAISLLWVIVMAKFNDPEFDYFRKHIVWLCVITALIVGIHHALTVEDDQVIKDSNAAKQGANK